MKTVEGKLASNRSSWDLMLISFISLFLELAIIRWLSAEIRIFAYYKNLPLMAAFLGFGIGFMLHQKSGRLFFWFPRLICCLVIIIAGANGFGITHVIFLDPRQYFLLGTGFGDHAVQSIPSLLQTAKALFVIISIFFLVMVTFAALASKVGELLNKEKSLVGYSINVAGSLLGILCFSLVSYLEWPPSTWLVLIFLPLFYFYRDRATYAGIYFLATIAFTLYTNIINPAIWSPYYRISLDTFSSPKTPKETHLMVNYDGFQVIQDLSESYMRRYPDEIRRVFNRHYNIPYFLSKRAPHSVLILGGGTGNDAAAALRNGASLVDVVEIDPVIARLGQELHPEKPYKSEKVSLYVDDARSFLQRTSRRYDLVIFATLDSHTVFSSLSSLRLDNFIFTKESIQAARQRLNPGGGIAINFFNAKPWLSQRHLVTLKEAMGTLPLTYASPGNQEVILLAGDCFETGRDLGATDYQLMNSQFTSLHVEPTSDDWPFLFLEKRGMPLHYVLPLLLITALAIIPFTKSQLKVANLDWHLFFMGAAFLLLESKAVTTLALIFGSTWTVNSIVISSILITILVANLLNTWLFHLSFHFLYTGLFAALVFNFLFSFSALDNFDRTLQLLTSGAIIGLPIFFAAIIFAKAFAVVRSPSLALASNLLGGLVGGLLEYVDMWTGLKWLNLIAVFLYLVSFIFLLLRTRSFRSKTVDSIAVEF